MSLPLFYFKDLSLSFGQTPLFSNISAQVSAKDRVCLIGKNGSGKSTLLKLMAGEIEPDQGELYYHPGIKISYLLQQPVIEQDLTIYQYVLQNISLKKGEELEQKSYLADIILEKLQLDGEKYLSKLSGGQLRRADLARTLVIEPDLLFLDEPTNHLDIGSIEWLEGYLNNFSGGLIVVSHDRAFLRNISNKTIWLDRGKLLYNKLGFNDFERWSEETFAQEERELIKLGKELDKENIWLQQGVTARRKRNQQRLQNLYELRAKLKSDKSRFGKIDNGIKLDSLALNNRSKLLVEMENVSFEFPERKIFKPFSLSILKGEVIGVMGCNGAGKSTLIKLITGDLKPSSGSIKLGHSLECSYLDQSRGEIDPEKTLWETLCPNGGDTIFLGGSKPKHVVAYLKDFLFDGKQAKSKVSTLSGGEQNRLLLARLLINPGNFLILDEPTNDLDMDTLDMLVEILSEYKGTLLIVSHDRDFLERLANRTLIIDNNQVHDHAGGYYDYVASTKNVVKEAKVIKDQPKKVNSSNKLSYKYERELELLPGKVEMLISEIKELEKDLSDPDLYSKDLDYFNDLTNKITSKREQIEEFEVRWLELEELKNKL
ncbi:MAG: ATP-binding cassette domain-containing protein [Rickettsiales bacterium]|jgi:ATP-binding cassette subfamily F protein uup|nr:ATP-binding cassette domain-containing protein [Rickettsiales bacterium]